MNLLTLSWIDYTLFAVMSVLSGLIGIYFGFYKKQSTPTDYLLGGREMQCLPVAMSLAASTLSGVTLLGIPSEIYAFGGQFLMILFCFISLGFVCNFIYFPVLYHLKITNSYDYFEMRFDRRIKIIASVLYTVRLTLFLPTALYAPALALNQVTGIDLYLIASAMSLFCIFYTTLGGLKAVVWTDTLQLFVCLCTLLFIFAVGIISVGGFKVIWEKAQAGDRLEFFNMDPDPTLRTTFWTVVVGNFATWISTLCTAPAPTQRYNSIPTYREAQKSLIMHVILIVTTYFIGGFTGFIIYAKYFDCDPFTAGYIKKLDQILPYYVLDVSTNFPGIGGLFLSGIFSATLSTLSTYLNTLSGIIYLDFVAHFMPANTTEKTSTNIMKILTVLIGLLSLSLVFIVEKLGPVLELMISLKSVTTGPLVGLFTMGMIFPFANTKGALIGSIGSVLVISFIAIGSKIHVLNGTLKYITKPFNTYGCNDTFSSPTSFIAANLLNTTICGEGKTDCPPIKVPFWLYRISYHYYALISVIVTLILGLSVSWFTRNRVTSDFVKPELLTPCIRKYTRKGRDGPANTEELLVLKD